MPATSRRPGARVSNDRMRPGRSGKNPIDENTRSPSTLAGQVEVPVLRDVEVEAAVAGAEEVAPAEARLRRASPTGSGRRPDQAVEQVPAGGGGRPRCDGVRRHRCWRPGRPSFDGPSRRRCSRGGLVDAAGGRASLDPPAGSGRHLSGRSVPPVAAPTPACDDRVVRSEAREATQSVERGEQRRALVLGPQAQGLAPAGDEQVARRPPGPRAGEQLRRAGAGRGGTPAGTRSPWRARRAGSRGRRCGRGARAAARGWARPARARARSGRRTRPGRRRATGSGPAPAAEPTPPMSRSSVLASADVLQRRSAPWRSPARPAPTGAGDT